jgi:hypothetical protein
VAAHDYRDLLIQIEDKRFWAIPASIHSRCCAQAWQLAHHCRVVSGGSTITMQVARLHRCAEKIRLARYGCTERECRQAGSPAMASPFRISAICSGRRIGKKAWTFSALNSGSSSPNEITARLASDGVSVNPELAAATTAATTYAGRPERLTLPTDAHPQIFRKRAMPKQERSPSETDRVVRTEFHSARGTRKRFLAFALPQAWESARQPSHRRMGIECERSIAQCRAVL